MLRLQNEQATWSHADVLFQPFESAPFVVFGGKDLDFCAFDCFRWKNILKWFTLLQKKCGCQNFVFQFIDQTGRTLDNNVIS